MVLEYGRLTSYWIFKVADEVGGIYGRKGIEIFEHRSKEGFWGIRVCNEKGKAEKNIGSLAKGDFAVFYLVSTGGNCFVGTAVLDSGFEALNEEQEKRLIHREYIDWHQGVFLKGVNRWARPVPVEYLRENKAFQGGNMYFQGRIKKIDASDYEVIFQRHKLLG